MTTWQAKGAHGGEGWCRCAVTRHHPDVESKPYLCVCNGLLRPARCRCVPRADPYGIAGAWREVDGSLGCVMREIGLSSAESVAARQAFVTSQRAPNRGAEVAKDPCGCVLYQADLDAMNEAVRALRGDAGGDVVCGVPASAEIVDRSFGKLCNFVVNNGRMPWLARRLLGQP